MITDNNYDGFETAWFEKDIIRIQISTVALAQINIYKPLLGATADFHVTKQQINN